MEIPVLISDNLIRKKVKLLSEQISKDYINKQPLLIGILNGAFVFTADLIRYLTIPVRCDFMRVSSYNQSTQSSGKIKIIMNIDFPVKNKDIIIVDDIIDTGLTTRYIINRLKRQKPRSIKICALLNKPSRRIIPIKIDYCGFTIPNKFVVGYGIDYKEQYRQLHYIGYLPS
ncbi:MAG: hypoxanthine phosphoribosyltransferase [Planctomycetota bacterium]